MKEEPRYMQERYIDQENSDLYKENREKFDADRRALEYSSRIARRSLTNGLGSRGHKQDGVEVLRGPKEAVWSDTKADGARMTHYTTGIPIVNEEASKIDGAPMAPGEDLPWEATPGSAMGMEGEV